MDRLNETMVAGETQSTVLEWNPTEAAETMRDRIGDAEAPWTDGPIDYEAIAKEAGVLSPVLKMDGGSLVTLDELAGQMRFYADGSRNDYLHMCMNLLQCGRVMTEAKSRVPHGEWESWVEENSGFSFRNAEHYMQAYQAYGLNPDIAKLGKTKMIRLLPVPEDIRTKILEEHDLEKMSTRDFERILKEEKEKAAKEAQAKAWAEAGQRMDAARQEIQNEADAKAQARTEEAVRKAVEAERAKTKAEAKDNALLAELANKEKQIAEQQEELERLAATGRESLEEQRRLASENASLQNEIRKQEDMLNEQQADLNKAQEELLNMQSAIAKGDAERVPADQLTADAFAKAVRTFIGTVARMPHMRSVFAGMGQEDRQEYSVLLETVEKWCSDSRKALDTVSAGGVII